MKDSGKIYKMVLDLSQGTDRCITQDDEPHIIFSNAYSNLLSFSYASDSAITHNFAYTYGHSEGSERKYITKSEQYQAHYINNSIFIRAFIGF